MTPKDDLFQLIHSLTQHEKSYFKKYAQLFGRKRTQAYLELFDAINRQKTFNEDQIKQELSGHTLLQRLSATKHYLYHLILKSMRAYHSDISALREVQNLLADCTFLIEKNLYKQAYAVLRKARTIAEESHNLLAQYLVALRERNFNDPNVVLRSVSTLSVEESFAAERNLLQHLIDNSIYAEQCHIFAQHVSCQGATRNEQAPEHIRAAIQKVQQAAMRDDISVEGKILVYQFLVAHYMFICNYRGSYQYCRLVMDLFDASPRLRDSHPYKYLYGLMNLSTLCRMLHRYDEAFGYIQTLEHIAPSSHRAAIEIQIAVFMNRYFLYLDKGAFAELTKLQKQIETFLGQHSRSISDSMHCTFAHAFALTQFYCGNPEGALNFLHKLFDIITVDSNEAIYCFAKILHVLVHYELGNTSFLPYETASTYRYLKKRKRLYRFETIIMRFLRKMPRLQGEKQFRLELEQLYPKLEALRQDPYENSAFSFCNVLVWVESKLHNRSMAEIIQARIARMV